LAGRYVLVEKIGVGGMGEVWVARQTEPVSRKVALKLVKTGMDSKAVLARFNQERQALALMDHPNIARVFDGGMTPNGQPFFAMELVKGLPLNRFCDENRLTLHSCLELFVLICQAVQHAHQKGIVHRDLKPANILVTTVDGKPVPKVIDFGVAKATAGKLTDEAVSTQFGSVVGTLEYMSPEQAGLSGEDVDTRADIYSLGVILYEILTGLRPIDASRLKNAAVLEMIRIIREEEPPRPSTRLSTDASLPALAAMRQTEPRRLMSMLRGELDWVVMKCLEKQRERRFETASALARDIQRYLANEPVEARPPSARYRLGKLLKRNKGAVIAASLVLVSLVAGVLGTSLALIRARAAERLSSHRLVQVEVAQAATLKALGESESARKKAETAEIQSKSVADYLVDIFEKPDPNADGRLVKLADVLDKAVAKLEGDKNMAPVVRARLQNSLGRAYFSLGLSDKAIPLLRSSCATYEANLGLDHPDTLDALYNLSYILGLAGQNEEGIQISKRVLERDMVLHGPEHMSTLLMLGQLGSRYFDSGRLAEALEASEAALAGQRKLKNFDPAILANTMTNLAMAYRAVGRTDDAIRLQEESIGILTEKKGADHAETLLAKSFLARAYRTAGRFDEAVALLRDSLTKMREKYGPEHPRTLRVQSDLGTLYRIIGKHVEALTLHEDLAQISRRVFQDNPDRILDADSSLALTYVEVFRRDEAIQLMRSVVERARTTPGVSRDTLSWAVYDLGVTLRQAGRAGESIPCFEEAAALRRTDLGEDNVYTQLSVRDLASAYESVGRASEAIPLLERVVAWRKARFAADHRDLLADRAALALAYGTGGRTADAVKILEEVVASDRRKFPPTFRDTLTCSIDLADAYARVNRLDLATATYRDLLATFRPTLGADPANLSRLLAGYGRVLLASKAYSEAEPLLRECLTIREKVLANDWLTFDTRSMLGEALAGLRNDPAALPLLVAGYEGLKQRADRLEGSNQQKLTEALDRLIAFHDDRDQPDESARWRKQRTSNPKPDTTEIK
jgi:serine/threonine protein kinase/lipopolysaccharide biosynthesis regulator YciM